MPKHIVVVEKRSDFRWNNLDVVVMTAQEYIHEGENGHASRRRVTNLCRSYSYLSLGYYVSLLAEARGDRVAPDVEAIVDLQNKAVTGPQLVGLASAIGELDWVPPAVNAICVPVFFGEIGDSKLAELGRRVFEQFRIPLVELDIERSETGQGWRLGAIRALNPTDVDAARDDAFIAAIDRHTSRPWRRGLIHPVPHMDLAILHDPQDPLAPTNTATLEAFRRVGADLGISVDLIGRSDLGKLSQYDALFIRETTAVAHHTFRFSRKASVEGMPVMDDPTSILRCTNKAYLSELLTGHGLSTPKTLFVTRKSLHRLEGQLSYPVVLKVPDGAFSLAVKKASSWREFHHLAQAMLKQSDLILVQEYLYTPFDWRIGILAGKVIFAAKYFMYEGHWQIIDHDGPKAREGETQAVAVADVPVSVREAALSAAALIGNGLYGVDIKEDERGTYVIEVNDNPNINLADEGQIEGEDLLRTILREFHARVEARHAARPVIRLVGKPTSLPPVAATA